MYMFCLFKGGHLLFLLSQNNHPSASSALFSFGELSPSSIESNFKGETVGQQKFLYYSWSCDQIRLLRYFLLKVELEKITQRQKQNGEHSSLWRSVHLFDPAPLIFTATILS